MSHPATPTNNQPRAVDRKVGYKRPPTKNQFRKGQSGNPRGRWKGQRNLPAVLAEILHQTVVVKQGDNSERTTKGEALIKMLMSKAHNGDRRAVNAMLIITEKIGRVENAELRSGVHRYGFMLVPGVAASKEEWQRGIAARPKTPAFGKAPAAGPTRRTVKRPLSTETSPPKPNELTPESISEAVAQSPPIETATAAVPTDARTVTRRQVRRRETSPPEPDNLANQSIREAAALLETPPVGTATAPVLPAPRTGTYRQVNRNKSGGTKPDT